VALVRKGINSAGRDFCERFFCDHTISLERLKTLGKGAGVYTPHGFFELAKAFWAATEVADDESGPFLTDYPQGGSDAAYLGFNRGRRFHRYMFLSD
jgi:hypothetical protein